MDIDGDGDNDLFVGEKSGALLFFQNTGSAQAPNFVEQVESANPFYNKGPFYAPMPTFVDIDGDGDFDAFVAQGIYSRSQYECISYFENTGSPVSALFTERTGGANPFSYHDLGYINSLAFADINADGDYDAFIGQKQGAIKYFDNIDVAPALFSLTLPGGTTVADYRILSMPLHPLSAARSSIFDEQIGVYDPTMMRIAAWDADTQSFDEYPIPGDPGPGDSAWFLFRNSQDLSFSGYKTPQLPGPMNKTGFFKYITQGWNMIGNPFDFEISVNSIIVKDSTGESVLTQAGNQITQPVFWIWVNGDYEPALTLPPATGGWVLKLTSGDGEAFFAAEAVTRDVIPAPVDTRGLEKPPAPPAFITQSGTEASGGGGCFIETVAPVAVSSGPASLIIFSGLSASLLGLWKVLKRQVK